MEDGTTPTQDMVTKSEIATRTKPFRKRDIKRDAKEVSRYRDAQDLAVQAYQEGIVTFYNM
jgi:predicted HTH domain antitoxin